MQRQPVRCAQAIAAKGTVPAGAIGMSSTDEEGSAPAGPVCGQSLGIPGVAPPCRASASQEPALLGLPMHEAHRSWQLFGQCRAAIIMSAARNRIRHSPALLLA